MRSKVGLRHRAGLVSFVVACVALVAAVGWLRYSAQESVAQPGARVELPEKRTGYSRTYLNANGSYTTEFFDEQLNYKDTSGRVKPIDTDLAADTEGYEANANALAVDFAKGRGKLVTINRSNDTEQQIGFGPTDAVKDLSPAKKNAHSVKYAGYKDGIDLEYDVRPGRLKEGIVLSGPTSETAFVFELALKDLKPEPRNDGSIALIDTDTNKPSITIDAPYMTDAKAAQAGLMPEQYTSWDCTMSITSLSEGLWRLTVTCDKEWLADPARAWPVVIDPTFSVVTTAVADTYLRQDTPAGVYHSVSSMCCGSLGPNKAIKDLIRFDISAIPKSAQITAATLDMPAVAGSCLNIDDYANQTTTDLLRVTANWDTSACWNNMASNYDPSVVATTSAESAAFDVTNLISAWHNGEPIPTTASCSQTPGA